jgi:hypothetical protein
MSFITRAPGILQKEDQATDHAYLIGESVADVVRTIAKHES